MVKDRIEVSHSFSKDFVKLMHYLSGKYDENIFKIQGIANSNLDIVEFSKDFFNSANQAVADITVDGNANVNEKNIIQYNSENNKALLRLNSLYLLHKYIKKHFSKKDADRVVEYLVNGTIFINDMHLVNQAYCYSFDICNLLVSGMDFFKGNMKIAPPKRAESFIALVIQTTAYISNQISGAVAYPSFFVALNYLYEREFSSDYLKNAESQLIFRKKLENQFQNLIYSLNFPYRNSQSAFSNLSVLDRGFLESLFGEYVLPEGTKVNKENVLKLSQWFFEYYDAINGKEGMFTFPVMTLAISLDKDGEFIDPDFVDWCAKVNHSKSLANIFIDEPTSFSSCCRLRSDLKAINAEGYHNSFGVGGVSVGSVRVAGINLPRLYLDKNLNMVEVLNSVHQVLFAQRKLLEDRIKAKVFPLYDSGWMSLKRQYSTFGFVGAYEFMKYYSSGDDISQEGEEKLSEVLDLISIKMAEWQEADGFMYNLEQIPAESMAVRLAQLDKVLEFQDSYELYSNQYISLMSDTSIYERFRLQGKFDSTTSGGAILHLNIDEDKPLSEEQFKKLILLAKETGTKYFGVNYAFSYCAKGHCNIGKLDNCATCGGKITDRFTRVVGFLTNVKHWNKIRREIEFPKRVFYSHKVLD